MLLMITATI